MGEMEKFRKGMFESEEKVDYGIVINRQLDRIVRIRSEMYKQKPLDPTGLVTLYRALELISALKGLYSILVPELRPPNVKSMLSDARKFAMFLIKRDSKIMNCGEGSSLKPSKEECIKLHEEIQNKSKEIASKYSINEEMGADYLIYELCDMALTSILDVLNKAGLLMRGRQIKVGHV